QRMFASVQTYKPALEAYNTVDADVITFESSASGGIDLEAIGKIITEKKISIGVIDHHTLQVERPEEVANQIRAALKHIPAERLMVSSDCGMGREGMSRRHAFYKAVSIVLGTNIVRKELGAPQARVLAADERYSLVVPAKRPCGGVGAWSVILGCERSEPRRATARAVPRHPSRRASARTS